MTNEDKALIRAYAANDMDMCKTGKQVYMHYNSIRYRFGVIKRETGLEPRHFYDLIALLKKIGETV